MYMVVHALLTRRIHPMPRLPISAFPPRFVMHDVLGRFSRAPSQSRAVLKHFAVLVNRTIIKLRLTNMLRMLID